MVQHARIGQPRIDIEYLRFGDGLVCYASFFIGPANTADTVTADTAAASSAPHHKHVIIPTDILPRILSRSGTLSKKGTASKCIRYENYIVFIPFLSAVAAVAVVVVVIIVTIVSCSTAFIAVIIIICSTIVDMTMGYPP